MKAFEWIDRVKTARGLHSDYAAAKALGITQATISLYRKRGSTMDESASIVVAKTLGMAPAGVILDQAAERVKSPEARATLLEEARRLCILCLMPLAPAFATNLIAAPPRKKNIALLTCKRNYAC
ncbi:MAG: hypothetical protein JSR51_06675 [Proteobacteria bacterium]|nr:hypothetical protein [Pseudomonadota bacterium]